MKDAVRLSPSHAGNEYPAHVQQWQAEMQVCAFSPTNVDKTRLVFGANLVEKNISFRKLDGKPMIVIILLTVFSLMMLIS